MKSVVLVQETTIINRYIVGIDGGEERCKILANNKLNQLKNKNASRSYEVYLAEYKSGRWVREPFQDTFGFI